MLIKYLSKQDFMEEVTNKLGNNLYESIKELVESDMFSIRVFDQYQIYDTEDIVRSIRNCIETNKYNLDINVQIMQFMYIKYSRKKLYYAPLAQR